MAISRKVMLVDGANLLMRAIKALEHGVGPSMTVGDINTGPAFVFIQTLSRYVRDNEPDRIVVCWDGGKSTYRNEIFESYKGARHAREPEEQDQIDGHFALAKEFLSLAGVHHVSAPGVEADDLIAYYWRRRDPDWKILIVSGDKDFLQLLDGWTEQERPGQPNSRWTVNRVRTEMKCKPEHLPLVMALTGDAIDGVPGIPGFGHKTACKFLARYEWSLEALLNGAEPRLFDQRSAVMRNLALVDLRSVGPDINLAPPPVFEPTAPDSVLWGPLMDFLLRFEMHTVAQRIEGGRLWLEPNRIALDALP